MLFRLVFAASIILACGLLSAAEVNSPNGHIVVDFTIQDGQPHYSVSYRDRSIIKPSPLGLVFEGDVDFANGFRVAGLTHSTVEHVWEQPWGEQRFIRDHHNEMRVNLRSIEGVERKMSVVFRVFDDGLGFRYEIPEQEAMNEFRLTDELTSFEIDENMKTWWIPAYRDNRYEYHYSASPLDALDVVHTPVTMEGTGYVVSLHEAALVDYASMTLRRPHMHGQKLKADLVPWQDGVLVYGELPLTTPWRTIQIADYAHELADSRLILNLNEPNRLGDVGWAKPAKYIGIWWCMHINTCTWSTGERHGATTENAIRHLDFAAEHGFDGVLIEGWNVGWDGDWVQDGHKFRFTEPVEVFDIDSVATHARKVGVPVIGHHETGAAVENYESQLDEAFAFLERHGMRAVKTGYVGSRLNHHEWHHGQYMVRHFQRVIETAARHRVSINAHEPIKDTGLRRTWPNMMTTEAARGGEYDAWGPPQQGNHPSHGAVLPYTRLLAGPMDYTPGIVRLRFGEDHGVASTLARQLALMVVVYSPMQMAADLPENYAGHEAFDFIRQVPVDWEYSIALAGEIGDHFVIARKDRNGPEWYVGGVSGDRRRSVDVALDFLDGATPWRAEIYRDADDSHWLDNPQAWELETRTVSADDVMTFDMAPGGGVAVRLIPQR